MRKYQQLLLVVVSIFSLALLLVYRHEYNRLHYVLEVFNFFGQPCNFSELIESGNILNHHDWGPDPVWNQEGNINVYSTHLIDTNVVQSLVVMDVQTEHPRSCYLWFENNDWKPEIAKFNYHKIFSRGQYEGFMYNCSWTKSMSPFAVSYSKKYLSKHLVVDNPISSHKFNITLCIPPSKFMTKRYLAEFLSYHTLVGVDSFIIYSNVIPHKTMKLIMNLSRQLSFNVSFYQNNIFSNFMEILNEDCKLRTLKQSKFSLFVEVNEYLVPTSNINLLDALQMETSRPKLPVQKFCINEQLANTPIAVQNQHTIRDDETAMKEINANVKQGSNNQFTELHGGLISVHKYVFCLDPIVKTYRDNAIGRFADDFIKSTLFQMNLHNLL